MNPIPDYHCYNVFARKDNELSFSLYDVDFINIKAASSVAKEALKEGYCEAYVADNNDAICAFFYSNSFMMN